MRSSITAAGVVASILWMAASSSAQLGDVARKEAERRKVVKTSGKKYTNDNLRPEPQPSPGPVASGEAASPGTSGEQPTPPPASAAPAPAAPPAQTPEDRKQSEQEWRSRIKAERDALERAKTFADALQTKINALNTDFVNRDDPAQRNVVAADRERALAEMARLKKEIQDHTKAITSIQDEARRANVPAGWVR
jgi:DNA repair exonuclease SbcCD ATPase subunit